MIGIVLVTHGRLAQEFVDALEHVVGPQNNLTAICVGPEDDLVSVRGLYESDESVIRRPLLKS